MHRYYSCVVCGSEFGWEQVEDVPDDSCGLGVPEPVRRAASAPVEAQLTYRQKQAALVPLTLTVRRSE
jgi:hypothetical protein